VGIVEELVEIWPNEVCDKVKSELLFKVPPGWYGENASVYFLTEDVLGPLGSMTILEKHESPENFLLLVIELLRG